MNAPAAISAYRLVQLIVLTWLKSQLDLIIGGGLIQANLNQNK